VNDSKVKLNIEHKHSYSSMEKKATKDEIISTKVQSVRVIQAVDETKNEEDVKDLENAEILDKNENSGNAQGAEINVQNCDIAEYNRIAECQASAAEAARASMAKLLEEQAAAAKAEETARKEVEEIKILGIEEVIKTEEDIIVKEIAVQAAKLLEEAARKEYERQVLLQKERNNERIEIEKEAFMFEAEKVTEREAVRIESEAKKSRKISKEEREQNKRRRSKVSEADRLEALREAAIIEAKRVEAAKMKVDKEKLSKQDKIEATISFENTIAATVTDKAASLEKVNSTLVVNEAVPLHNAKAKEIIDEGAILEKVDLGTVTNEVARLENVEDTIALDEVVKHEQNNVFIDSDEATRYPKDETEIATDKAKKLKEVKASRADFKIIQIKNVYNDTGTEEAARSEMVKNATETDSAERLDKMKTNNNVPELDKKQSTKDNNSLGKEEPVEIKNKENSIVYEEAVTNKDDTKGKLIGDKMEEISTVEEEVREVGGVRGAVKDLEKEVDRLRKMSPPSNEDSTGALLAATSDLTLAFTSALTSLTEVEGDHEDLPPPPPALPLTQDTQDSTDIPSPPPPPIERMETPTPAPPPRPAPPAAIIEMEQRALNTLERKIETQYKKYPRQCESSPVQGPQASPSPQASPAPAPPQRNSSLPCTPRTNRKVTAHTVRRTPSPSRAKPLSPDSPHTSSTDLGDRAASGMYEAVPVYIGDSPVPSMNEGRVNGSILEGRRAFVDSMLRAEQVSMMVTAKMEGVRQHGGKEWRDFQEGDKKAERAIAGELEKRHKEAEEILRKKKEEEHLKRLEFEEERIKQENEKMKKDAEEKRKRDLEDARLQEMLKLKEEVQKSKSPAPIIIKKEPVDEETPEEKHHRREEEIMIKVGREEHFKELEKKKKLFEDKPETIKAELVEKSKEKPAHKEIRLGTIEEYIRPASAKVISKNSVTKEAKTVAVVEDREEGFSSFAVFQANKQIQKPKYQTFSDQSRNTENSSSSTSTSSRRWHNVNTGLVKDRSNLYLPQESVPSQEPSPRPLKKIFGAGRESELDSEAPWRRSEPREDAGKVQPRVALLGVMVEREGKEQIPVSREWSPGQSLVEELTLTMAELEALGAREEGGQANVVKCEGGGIKEVNKEEVHKGEKEM